MKLSHIVFNNRAALTRDGNELFYGLEKNEPIHFSTTYNINNVCVYIFGFNFINEY